MKRYVLKLSDALVLIPCARDKNPLAGYRADEVHALLAAVAETLERLPKRYAYLTHSEWQEAHDAEIKRALALLEVKP